MSKSTARKSPDVIEILTADHREVAQLSNQQGTAEDADVDSDDEARMPAAGKPRTRPAMDFPNRASRRR